MTVQLYSRVLGYTSERSSGGFTKNYMWPAETYPQPRYVKLACYRNSKRSAGNFLYDGVCCDLVAAPQHSGFSFGTSYVPSYTCARNSAIGCT
jgi:hypothetical protein